MAQAILRTPIPTAIPRHAWRSLIADIVLGALLLGPLMAPWLANLGLFPTTVTAQIIYTMGRYVCPQPSMGLMLAPPAIMAVCMRCYGTVIGFLLTRMLYALRGDNAPWLNKQGWRGVALMGLMIFAYPAEFAGQIFGLWPFDNIIVTVVGLITGVGLGLFFVPVLYHPAARRASTGGEV